MTLADNVQYIYDSLNRLIEVHYPDKIIHYTYDDAGNRTGMTVQVLVVAPSILKLSPRGAVVGGNAFTLRINGSNFTSDSVVQWNGENRPTTFISSSELSITVQPADILTLGTASVVVTKPTPSFAASNSQTFSIVQNAAINGRITSGGNGLSNVTLNLTGAESETTTTDGNGNFNFAVLSNGSYTITPTRQNYSFNPSSRTVNYSGISQTNLDFTASLVSYAISGRITQNGNGLNGVIISLSGSQTGQTTTDGNGNYSINATAEGNYVITPSLAGYTFSPNNQSFNNLSSNQTGDFTAVTTQTSSKLFDFDGDGKSDISVFRPDNGAWYIQQSQNGFTGLIFGFGTDLLAPADFDGDGKTDVAVFRDGFWYYLQSSNGAFVAAQFGQAGDSPRPADFDGDGKADINVFRPSNGTWYRLNSSTGAFFGVAFGQNGDIPVPADYDGDGKADIAVFRPSNGAWYYLKSSNGAFVGQGFGFGTDKPIPAAFQ